MTEVLADQRNRITEWLHAAPALMMGIIPLIMLILDVTVPAMDEMQYRVYPYLCRGAMLVSTIILLSLSIITLRGAAEYKPSHRRVPDITLMAFGCFAVWMYVSTCVNGFTHDALFSVPYRYVGVIDLTVFVLVYTWCSRQIRTEEARNTILTSYMITADLLGIAFIYDWFISDIAAIGTENPASGIFYHDNHYGYFLVIAVIISAGYCIFGNLRMTIAGYVSLGINIFVLAVNRTSGCFIAVVAALSIMMLYLLLYHREHLRKTLLLIVIATAGIILLLILSRGLRQDLHILVWEFKMVLNGTSSKFAGHRRWEEWTVTVSYIADEPVFGYGCEGLANTLYDYTGASSPHNEVLAYTSFFGIPGAVFYIAGCIAAIFRPLRIGKRKMTTAAPDKQNNGGCDSQIIASFAALGYLISSMFGVAMFYTVPYMFILLGLSVSPFKISE